MKTRNISEDRDPFHHFLILAARKHPAAFRLSPETQGRLDAFLARKAGTPHAPDTPGLQERIPFVTLNANT